MPPAAGDLRDGADVHHEPDRLLMKQFGTPVVLMVLAFAATECKLFVAAYDAGRSRDSCGGDGSEAIGRHHTLSNRLRFFAGLSHPTLSL